MRKLTDKQTEMIYFISDYIETHKFPPTIREIQAGLDIKNVSVVAKRLFSLEKKRYIEKTGKGIRNIVLLGEPIAA